MAYVVLVPDLARRPHYCFTSSFHVLRFDRVFGGLDGFVPREEMIPRGNPFVEQQEIDFVKQKLEQNCLSCVIAPATDYIRRDDNLAVGGIFREQQNTPQERESIVWW